MIRKLFLAFILIALGISLYFNPNFKTIAAGISILLFGMILLEEGFKVFAKGTLQKVLKKATNKLYKSISIGAFVTALIQSSSLVSVITISFISAGLISLGGGLGLIFGANIGTTATAWLVAGFGLKIKISALAMPMLIFGLIFTFQKKESLKGIGNVLAGLGFFFLGIHYMKEGFDVFKEYIDLTQYAIPGFLGVIIYTVLGILITTILQSSSATLALILTALAAGQIEYENALALAIGANVGTTITAILGSISSNVAGRRLAGAHLIFNVTTGIVALSLIYPLGRLVNILSEVVGVSATDYTLKLAMFHTIFNIIGVLIMLPFIKILERFLIRFIKEKANKDIDEPKFLTSDILKYPEALIVSLENESKYLYKNAIFEIVTHALNIHREDIKSDVKLKKVLRESNEDMHTNVDELYYTKVKNIYGQIISYATRGQSSLKLTEEENSHISEIKVANRKMIEIIRNVRELNKNVSTYTNNEDEQVLKEYDKFRKKIAKVLRVIYLFRKGSPEVKEQNFEKLLKLKEEARLGIHQTNKSINKLISKNKVSVDVGSSLVNDNDNVNDIIKKLIGIAELLYSEKDTLLEKDE